MYFKFNILLLVLHLLAVQSYDLFGINNNYRRFVKEFNSIAIPADAPIVTKWIEQKLDHFDANETRTWKMRYFERLDYWQPNGPIYLYVGGEAKAQTAFLAAGLLYDLARETNGAMYMSEHRYYGQSQPVKSLNVEDLKYLSAAQSLADNAELLKTIKNLHQNSKIVIVGGSYAGNLVAWMKLVYPDLVDAAISSSGPVEAQRDFYEYLEIVSKDYKQYGSPGCLERIQNIFQRYDSLFQSTQGIEQLKKEEHICEENDMTKLENKNVFFLTKAAFFMGTAQYGTTQTISDSCSKINKSHELLQTIDEQYNWNKMGQCLDYDFKNMVKLLKDENNSDALCWTYQTCTEFGYFQSTTSNNQPFTANIPVEFYDNLCTALFGPSFNKDRVNKGVQETNEMYKGKSLNVAEVVFVNGEMDPWSTLGILKDISNEAPAIYIPKSSHCRDLLPDQPGDPEELTEARKRIKSLVKQWIGA